MSVLMIFHQIARESLPWISKLQRGENWRETIQTSAQIAPETTQHQRDWGKVAPRFAATHSATERVAEESRASQYDVRAHAKDSVRIQVARVATESFRMRSVPYFQHAAATEELFQGAPVLHAACSGMARMHSRPGDGCSGRY